MPINASIKINFRVLRTVAAKLEADVVPWLPLPTVKKAIKYIVIRNNNNPFTP